MPNTTGRDAGTRPAVVEDAASNTKSNGLDARLDRIERLLSGNPERPPSPILFHEFALVHLRSVRHAKTRRDKESRMVRPIARWGCRYVHEIEREDVYRLKRDLVMAGLSSSTINAHVAYLSALFRDAVELGHAKKNPVIGIRYERVDSRQFAYIPPEKQTDLCDSMPNWKVRACVVIMLDTGVRISEFAALRLDDVRLGDSPEIVVAARGSGLRGKSRRSSRRVPLTRRAAVVASRLKSHAREQKRDTLCPYKSTSGYFGRLYLDGVEAAGLGSKLPGRFHALRHLYAANMVRSGVAMPDIARLMGIETALVVRCYGDHAPDGYGEAAVERLERMRGD